MEEIPASKKRKQLGGEFPQGFRYKQTSLEGRIALHSFQFWSQVLFSDQSTSEASMVAPSPETQLTVFSVGADVMMRQPENNISEDLMINKDWLLGWWFHSEFL